jgi:hypothetical protein
MPRGWETILALFCAAAAGVAAPASLLNPAVSEIIPVVGAILAALIPAMILAATALRAGSFSESSLRKLSTALDRQINVFGGLFLYGLLTCALLIIGKTIEWKGPGFDFSWGYPSRISVGWALMVCSVFGVCLLITRSIAIIAGIRSILMLQTQIAIAEAANRDRASEAAPASELANYRSPEGYGGTVDLPH